MTEIDLGGDHPLFPPPVSRRRERNDHVPAEDGLNVADLVVMPRFQMLQSPLPFLRCTS